MLFQIDHQLLGNNIINGTSCLTVAQFLLGLTFKLRIFNLDAYDHGKTFTDIITGKCLGVLDQFIQSRIRIKSLCQCIFKTSQMGSAFRSRDVIYKTVGTFGVSIVVLHGNFHINIILHSFTVNNIRVKRCLAFIQVSHKLLDTALIMEGLFDWFFRTVIS